MKIRPVREGGRVRFRIMNAEKGISPGTVPLDPRSDSGQETMGRAAPAAPVTPREAEIIVPDPVVPDVVVPPPPKPKKGKSDVQD
jgi:hypothetical protein